MPFRSRQLASRSVSSVSSFCVPFIFVPPDIQKPSLLFSGWIQPHRLPILIQVANSGLLMSFSRIHGARKMTSCKINPYQEFRQQVGHIFIPLFMLPICRSVLITSAMKPAGRKGLPGASEMHRTVTHIKYDPFSGFENKGFDPAIFITGLPSFGALDKYVSRCRPAEVLHKPLLNGQRGMMFTKIHITAHWPDYLLQLPVYLGKSGTPVMCRLMPTRNPVQTGYHWESNRDPISVTSCSSNLPTIPSPQY